MRLLPCAWTTRSIDLIAYLHHKFRADTVRGNEGMFLFISQLSKGAFS